LAAISRVAAGDQHVVVRGDSSGARSLVARAIHAASSRHAAPFVELDAGDTTAASQLKGFLAGLALGPGNDPANVALLGGTLYLDRVEQLGREEQSMLLGALGSYLGNGKSKGVRVIGSSAHDLKEGGRLLPELWRLLAADELSIPSLGAHPAMPGAASAEIQALVANPMTLDDLERLAIEAALKRSRGNVTRAMRQLGIGRTTLYRKLKRYNLR
jgi:DNA-binding NtrC family response regulator